jgi:glycosyltransferase involved in cell wall biosynthesis
MALEVEKHRIVPHRRLRMIRNGIDTAAYREASDPQALRKLLGIPLDAPVIGTVGRLVQIKRYDLLIRSFARVRRSCPKAHLILVGDGPQKLELQQLVAGLGIGDRVHFAGYQIDVNRYLHIMDCFALTSRSEGTPQAVLEASIAGLPVVASRVGGLPEVIDDGRTGILFEPGDEDTLTRELIGILLDKDRARRLGEAASIRVQSLYGVGRMAKEYHNHYLRLLEN